MFPLRSGALAPQQELCLVDNNVHREGEQYDNVSDLADASLEHWGLGSDVGSESTSQERTIRRRSSKACDQCRKYKCKCERSNPNEPCKNCVMLGTQCTFSGPSRKRGPPKGYIDAIEARLHQTEALTLQRIPWPRKLQRALTASKVGNAMARGRIPSTTQIAMKTMIPKTHTRDKAKT